MFFGITLFVVGVALVLAPMLAPNVSPMAQVISMVFGAVVLLVDGVVMAATRLYQKTSANQALVRTGQGGSKVVLDGGIWFISIFHKMIPVSLETMKLDVRRDGPDALITKDNLRVDVTGEFFIKVSPSREDILAASRSLGSRSVDSQNVGRLVFEKLVSGLRSVAATMDLVEIHAKRTEFAQAVFESVREDLKHNGLTLESVTISRLDQTPLDSLRASDNIFDAQGQKKVVEITTAAQVETNRLKRDSERATREKDVDTRKQVLTLEREQAEAEASQQMQVANVQAEKTREREQFRIVQERQVREAEIAKEQAIQERIAQQKLAIEGANIDTLKQLIAREQEKQTADILRQQAVQTADIEKQKMVEVAQRNQMITVAEKDAERAAAEAEALAAQSKRMEAEQQVVTVKAVAEANREKETQIIASRQLAEQLKIDEQNKADIAAYQQTTAAVAEQQAAEKHAEAQLRMAQASAESKRKEAEGDQALKMVDVNVEREKVNVESARVDVERQELQNREQFGQAGIELEKFRIQMETMKDVQIQSVSALAPALAQMMSSTKMTIYGDPNTAAQMMERIVSGMKMGAFMDGMVAGIPPNIREALASLANGDGKLKEALEKLTGTTSKENGETPVKETPPVIMASKAEKG